MRLQPCLPESLCGPIGHLWDAGDSAAARVVAILSMRGVTWGGKDCFELRRGVGRFSFDMFSLRRRREALPSIHSLS